MNRLSLFIDRLNTLFANLAAFSVVALAFLVFYDAFMRYLFHEGSIALQELEWHLFDISFLWAAGYALKHDKHVRVDIFFDRFPLEIKKSIEFLDALLLIIPFSLLLIYDGSFFTWQSFVQNEASSDPGGLPWRYLIKAQIVVFAILLGLQALSEMIKLWPYVKKRVVVITSLVIVALVVIASLSEAIYWVHPAILMFALALVGLMLGFRVAFVFAGVGLLFALVDVDLGLDIFAMYPLRIYGIMQNFTLIAVPLFILMGLILEKSDLAKSLLENIGALFGSLPGGLGIGVVLVGALLAAATGIVGASVVMMSIISLPIMIRYGYAKSLASGTIAASGTLGQIIPPSIVLIVLGDVLSVSVGELFKAAVVPGLLLVLLYIGYIFIYAKLFPNLAPPVKLEQKPSIRAILASILPTALLIFIVLGSIFVGIATPTESAAMGVVGALILVAFQKRLSFSMLHYVAIETVKLSAMIFTILIGATAFSLVFNEIGGGELVHNFFAAKLASPELFLFVAMASIFILGFFIDFIEISFVVIPLFVPVLHTFHIDPIWFGILVALNLQASFLTPPFGFALFYLKGSAGKLVSTIDIYKGVIPFILLQLLALAIIYFYPNLLKVF